LLPAEKSVAAGSCAHSDPSVGWCRRDGGVYGHWAAALISINLRRVLS